MSHTLDIKNYNGSQIFIGLGPMGGGIGISSPHEYVYKYPKGKQIKVYYDPKDPKQSVLEPGVNRVITLILLTGIFFLILGTFILRQMYRGDPQVTKLSKALKTGNFLGSNDRVDYSQILSQKSLSLLERILSEVGGKPFLFLSLINGQVELFENPFIRVAVSFMAM